MDDSEIWVDFFFKDLVSKIPKILLFRPDELVFQFMKTEWKTIYIFESW